MTTLTNRTESALCVISMNLLSSQQPAQKQTFRETILILFRWKGSIYKTIWKQMLVYCVLFYSLTIVYKVGLDEEGKIAFRALAKYFSKQTGSLNLMIMLGFFTTTAMQRLFTMHTAMPGTAKLISFFLMSIKQDLPEGPVLVEQFARWAVLSWVLTYRIVSKPLRDLFPDMVSLQRAGLIRENERYLLDRVEPIAANTTPRPLLPIDWMLLLARDCATENRYPDKGNYVKLLDFILGFKKSCGNTIKFATKNLPHALIQAAIIFVYVYGLITLMSRNFDGAEKDVFLEGFVSYVPAMPSLQFFIFLIWLNFGRTAVNPFGSDDDDIDVQQLLKTHVQDSLRLASLYNKELDDIFDNMP
ncbi:bestrophin-4-like [Daphnia pulicaria]|uniref:bestrophin-4-like n=1 Tax=Daphnia pulicaria TaxID=35523 RepID=UPI001EECD7CC|nr:bestrophin-4-like [Daphnia pulicaria]